MHGPPRPVELSPTPPSPHAPSPHAPGRAAPRRPWSRASLPLAALAVGLTLAAGAAQGDVPPDDGVPTGMVAFFAGPACPAGWTTADTAAGRIVVGTARGVEVGQQVGKALGPAEDRAHRHTFTGTAPLAYKSVSAADGSNNQGAAAATYDVAGSTMDGPSGLPFIQLTACRKP